MFCTFISETSVNDLGFISHVLRLEERVDEELCKPIQSLLQVTALNVEVKYHLQPSIRLGYVFNA